VLPLTVGARHERLVCPEITRTQIVQFAGASGDFSPLHTDELRAREAGYPGVLAHGMMVMAASATAITDWLRDGRLIRFRVRFRRPVVAGDTLTTAVTVEAVRDEMTGRLVEFTVSTTNQAGVEVLSGQATARLEVADPAAPTTETVR